MVTLTNQMDSLGMSSSEVTIGNIIRANRKKQDPLIDSNLKTMDQSVSEYTKEDALLFAGGLGLKDLSLIHI